jgi:hypothetical protein
MNLILEKQTKVSPKKKVSKNYFTQETEDAIVLYNNTSDPTVRSSIYEEKIHYAFFKLTQNIIHTFKFYHTEVDNLEHLQHEIIVFLLKGLKHILTLALLLNVGVFCTTIKTTKAKLKKFLRMN